MLREERLAASLLVVIRLHQPHAILMTLHVHRSNVIILTAETAGTVSV